MERVRGFPGSCLPTLGPLQLPNSMLTTLAALKTRLAILDTSADTLLTQIIVAVSARFDLATDRILARTADVVDEFEASRMVCIPRALPVESVDMIEVRTSGVWTEVSSAGLSVSPWFIAFQAPPGAFGQRARVTYTGGYVLPGTAPGTGQVPLPQVLNDACIEEAALVYQTREHAGIFRMETGSGLYLERGSRIGSPWVLEVLRRFHRFPGS